MTETHDNIIDRDVLQDAYINEIIDSMDIKDLMRLVYDQLDSNLETYTVNELIEEVEEYYPHLLEDAKWDSLSLLSLSSSVQSSAPLLFKLSTDFKMKNYPDSANQSQSVHPTMKCARTSDDIIRRYYNVESDSDWDDILSPDDIEEYYERRQYEKMMCR